jgi:hypothetical protein
MNMTPKEKAFELKYKYSKLLDLKSTDELVLQCALNTVDEINEALDRVLFPNPFEQYWNEVKHEIEKL